MIVTTGKIIKIRIDCYQLERSSETPGLVTVRDTRSGEGGGSFHLPGNEEDAQRLADAYMRIVAEDIGYRKQEVE